MSDDFPKVMLARGESGGLAMSFRGDDACQGEVFPEHPQRLALLCHQCLMTALAFLPREPERACLVGLGPGALPRFLRHQHPALDLEVVETDPEVIAAALGPFALRTDPSLRLHQAEGRAFLEASDGGYDLLVLDAFEGSSLPYPLATREFLALARERLNPGGVLAANLPTRPGNRYLASILAAYGLVFPGALSREVPDSGNLALVCPQSPPDLAAALARAARFSGPEGVSFDMAGLLAGFRPLAGRHSRARPLTDALLRRTAAP